MAKILTQDDHAQTLANYLPSGRAFGAKNVASSVTRALLLGLSGELVRSDALIAEFRDEILPDTTTLLIEEWESAVGIPDDCFSVASTIEARRLNVVAKLASLGAQTAADFVAILALYGIVGEVIAGSVHGVFPMDFPIFFFATPAIARHTIIVNLPGGLVPGFPYTFPVVFGSEEQNLVECLFNQLKPANVDVVFDSF